ncbi:MAG: DUF1385 domain-containing protein [Candidatus Cloacimonadota bacterium]|nr:DUF1385 domain-containing protein [Candidatus Cloacimonadota bacterium]
MENKKKRKKIEVGGQAVIEGVMMRGPEHIATAIRRKDKSIEIKKERFKSITQKVKFLGIPIVRGFVSLFEMMFIGYKTLTFSVQRAELDMTEEESQKKKSPMREKIEEVLSFVFAMGLAFLLFAFLPYQISEWIGLGKKNVYFNLFAGVTRITFFVVYVWAISLLKDVKQLFRYHGAEHKSVYAYENKDELIPENIQKYSTLHPRCGTSFIFVVLLISIFVFSILDTIFAINYGKPSVLVRLGYHFLFMPFVAGISYEFLKFSGRNREHFIVKLFTFPGLSLQRITTQPPTDEMVEVSSIALKAALEMDLSEYKNLRILD